MSYLPDGYDEIPMRGVTAAWFRDVPIGHQREVMSVAKELRVLWNREIDQWTLIHECPGITQGFEDGHLVGWTIVTHFSPGMTGENMAANIRGMMDRNAYASVGAASEALERRRAAEVEKAEKESHDRLDAILTDAVKNEDAVTRDYAKWAEETQDQRHRAHAHTRAQIAAGEIPVTKVDG